MVPEHIWKDQDPLTFKFYDPEKGYPVCTGPYKLAGVSPTEVTWTRDDNWWGAKTGVFKLPEPETIIWTWAGPEETRAALMADDQLDSLMDITLGALQALQAQNPNVITWFTDMPKAWVPDPVLAHLQFNLTARAVERPGDALGAQLDDRSRADRRDRLRRHDAAVQELLPGLPAAGSLRQCWLKMPA